MSENKPRLSFTEADIAVAASRPQLKLGWYYWLVKSAETKVTEKGKNPGSLMIVCQLAPCEEPGDPTTAVGPMVYHNLILPLANPEVDGHKAPNTAGLVAEFLRACFDDEIPAMPRRIDGTLTFQGEEIGKEEELTKRQEVMREVYKKIVELWDDPSPLVNCGFYGELIIDKTGEYRNVSKMGSELPADATLVPRGEFKEEPAVAVAAPKTNAKAAPKAAGKKR